MDIQEPLGIIIVFQGVVVFVLVFFLQIILNEYQKNKINHEIRRIEMDKEKTETYIVGGVMAVTLPSHVNPATFFTTEDINDKDDPVNKFIDAWIELVESKGGLTGGTFHLTKIVDVEEHKGE